MHLFYFCCTSNVNKFSILCTANNFGNMQRSWLCIYSQSWIKENTSAIFSFIKKIHITRLYSPTFMCTEHGFYFLWFVNNAYLFIVSYSAQNNRGRKIYRKLNKNMCIVYSKVSCICSSEQNHMSFWLCFRQFCNIIYWFIPGCTVQTAGNKLVWGI